MPNTPQEQKQEILRTAGEILFEQVTIISSSGKSMDITGQTIQIEIYEDLFSPLITGQITLAESFNLIAEMPFLGQEILSIKLRTPTAPRQLDKTIQGNFYIFKLTNREQIADRTTFYVLHFISIEAIADINVKLSKTYNGKISDIVEQITKKEGLSTKKNVYIEPTRNNIKYISNFWSPIENINFLTKRAINQGQSANYVFFEDHSGLKFCSLDFLYGLPVRHDFILDDYGRSFTSKNQTVSTPEEGYKRILGISTDNSFDYIKRAQSGFLTTKLITTDLVTKKYAVSTLNYIDNFKNTVHLNTEPVHATSDLITRDNALLINHIRHYSNFDGIGNDGSGYWLQQHIMQMNTAQSNTIKIVVPGRTDMQVGQKCLLLIYKNAVISKDDPVENIIDKSYSGAYIISAIQHQINRADGHLAHLEIISDSNIK